MKLSRVFVVAIASLVGLVGCGSEKAKTTTEVTVSETSALETASQSTVTPTTEEATTASETTPPSAPASDTSATSLAPGRVGAIEITPSSLGEFKLGQDAQSVIDGLTALLGEPTEDSGWQVNESPCEDTGEKNRYMNFGRVSVGFAVGPTLFVPTPGEHFSSFSVFDGNDVTPGPERFVFSDRQQVLGRTKEALLVLDKDISFSENEIQGSIWSLGSGKDQMFGSFTEPDGGGAKVVRSVEVGLFCID
jgi:hypothetical protein